MISINANTKIAYLLKQHPDALEAIISISPKFNKLKNPLLRKLMAGRTSISMASKIGGCTVNDFFEKLKPLGFQADLTIVAEEDAEEKSIPDFVKNRTQENTVDLDVRDLIEEGKDPLSLILEKTNTLKGNQILRLINSFDPIPLIQLFEKKGYQSYSEIIDENLVHTYFLKPQDSKETKVEVKSDNWEELMEKFGDKIKTIDVRNLEMPLPMLTILDELDKLANGYALYVYHKRIPVFLLPELQERNFDYRIKEISDNEVNLFIFKP